MVAQRLGEPMAGLGVEIAVGEMRFVVRREPLRPSRRLRSFRPKAASPMVPVTQIRSPAWAVVRRTIRPVGTSPTAVTDRVSGPFVFTVSPPRSGQEKSREAAPEAGGESGEPALRSSRRARRGSGGNRPDRRPWRQDPRRSRRAPCGRWSREDPRAGNGRARPGRRWSGPDRARASASGRPHRP